MNVSGIFPHRMVLAHNDDGKSYGLAVRRILRKRAPISMSRPQIDRFRLSL
jgi:hypothetical protein